MPSRFFCAAVLAAAMGLASLGVASAAERPNILFIMSDDHGYQAIGAYGSVVNQTPNIDRIAKDGMRFDRAFVTNSICGPSRAVVLTGKYGHLNGFVRNGQTFNGEQQTVAKLLQKAGYQTAMIGKWHLGTTPTGFDYYHVLRGQGPYYNPQMLTSDGPVKHTGYTTDIITDVALKWLKDRRDPDKPFLLMYQHKAPHRNWQPGPKHLTTYDDQEIPEPETLFDDYEGRGTAAKTQEMTVAKHLTPHDLKLVRQGGLTKEQQAAWDDAYGPKNDSFRARNLQGKELVKWKYQRYAKDYLRCIASVDDNVGRVLDYLEETGLDKNTVVFYTSDQGWYLGEHGWYDKRWMYEESFRTPLLVRWPGKTKPGSVSMSLVMNLDFAETFLDIAGVEIPDDMQGRSFTSILQGKQPEDWRKSVYYHYYEYPGAHMVRRHLGVRTDRYKLIHFYRINEWELYDLEKDPKELNSVYDDPDYQEVVQELKQELERLKKKYKDDGTVVDFSAQRARNVKLEQIAAVDFGKLEFGEVVQSDFGPAVRLDGSRPALTLDSGELKSPDYKPLTVGAWIKPESGSGVIAAHGGESHGWSLYLDDRTPTFAIRGSDSLTTATAKQIPIGQWTHVAATLNAEGQIQVFVDGVATLKKGATPVKSGFILSRPADGFALGADPGSLVGAYDEPLPFDGQIADFRLYHGVLGKSAFEKWRKQ